jgi:hypothetical protein
MESEVLFAHPWNMIGRPLCYQFKDGEDGHYYFGHMLNIAALHGIDSIVAIWKLKKRHQ